jgi:gluconokinase
MTAFIVMGISGSGKTTIGRCVADSLGWPFIEGDDFHSPANKAKMASGTPLTDADRVPWITALIAGINAARAPHTITACSALTAAVRTQLQAGITRPLEFIFLNGSVAVIEQRLQQRTNHFMRAEMLASQLAALDPPDTATVVEIDRPMEETCAEVREHVLRRSGGSTS